MSIQSDLALVLADCADVAASTGATTVTADHLATLLTACVRTDVRDALARMIDGARELASSREWAHAEDQARKQASASRIA